MNEQLAVIKVTRAQRREWKRLLNRRTADRQYDHDEPIETLTARFPDGMEVDIKLCNGDGPWVDAVLFRHDGHEVAVSEPGESWTDAYEFMHGGTQYTVRLVLAD